MTYSDHAGALLNLVELSTLPARQEVVASPSLLTLCWNPSQPAQLTIDGVPQVLAAQQILFLTEFHLWEIQTLETLRLVQFNRNFYCIADHDHEVGCKGVLFFGPGSLPIIDIPEADREKFAVLWNMFQLEMAAPDNLQGEMLQMLLKRMIILCTRLFKAQRQWLEVPSSQMDLYREFNYLVEMHYRQQHGVAFFAQALHKSPKTLANVFARLGQKAPLQVVQDRLLLEAQRRLRFGSESIKELAAELGFEDIQAFSRFFRKKMAQSPSQYRAEAGPRAASPEGAGDG